MKVSDDIFRELIDKGVKHKTIMTLCGVKSTGTVSNRKKRLSMVSRRYSRSVPLTEINYIKKLASEGLNCQQITNKCSEEFKRDVYYNYVDRIMRNHNIHCNASPREKWSKKEIEDLIRLVELYGVRERTGAYLLARFKNRTWDAIKKRASELKLMGIIKAKGGLQ